MLQRLEFVYGHDKAKDILPRVNALIERHRGQIAPRAAGWSQKDALLIAYADSILHEGTPPLRTLHRFLKSHVGDALSYVHLLPFFPFTSDDGFAVTDFRAVRDDLGTWDDVREFAADYRLVFDGVINHVSSSSVYMKGYESGDPAYKNFFISLPPDTDTRSVLRTRNLPLLHDYKTSDGTKWLWTTFSRDQIDLNFRNPDVLLEILDVLLGYAANGASMIRLVLRPSAADS
jgi:sucrose phosphorylase